MQIQVALKWAEGTYSWWSVLLSVFHTRSLPSWAHSAKYCRDLGEKTQGSCGAEVPPSAAISEALLQSACVRGVHKPRVSLRDMRVGAAATLRHVPEATPTGGERHKHVDVGWQTALILMGGG